jgi:hypothetical protein
MKGDWVGISQSQSGDEPHLLATAKMTEDSDHGVTWETR